MEHKYYTTPGELLLYLVFAGDLVEEHPYVIFNRLFTFDKKAKTD